MLLSITLICVMLPYSLWSFWNLGLKICGILLQQNMADTSEHRDWNQWVNHSGCTVHEQHTRKHTAMSDARKTIPTGRTPGKTPGTALCLIRPPLQWCMVEAASCCGGIPQLVDMVARVISAKHIHSLKVRCSTAISPGTGDSPSSPTKLEIIF